MKVSPFNYSASNYRYCRSRFAHLAFFLLLSFVPVRGSADQSATPSELPALEHFKSFIENSPPVDDIVFTYVGPTVSRFDRIGERWVQEPARIAYIRSSWSPAQLLNLTMQALKDVEVDPFSEEFDLKNGELLLQNGDNVWALLGQQKRVTYWKGSLLYPLADLTNPVLILYSRDILPLFSLMNMGPHLVPPKSIHWLGNRFKHVAHVFREDIVIEGELFGNTDGFPETMALKYLGPGIDGRYLVRYYYSSNMSLPKFLPERIHSVLIQGDHETADKDIEILSMKLAAPNHRSDYNLQSWLSHSQLAQYVFTNNELYAIGPTGEAHLIRRHKQSANAPFALAHANRYYYVASCIISIGCLMLCRRMKNITTAN